MIPTQREEKEQQLKKEEKLRGWTRGDNKTNGGKNLPFRCTDVRSENEKTCDPHIKAHGPHN